MAGKQASKDLYPCRQPFGPWLVYNWCLWGHRNTFRETEWLQRNGWRWESFIQSRTLSSVKQFEIYNCTLIDFCKACQKQSSKSMYKLEWAWTETSVAFLKKLSDFGDENNHTNEGRHFCFIFLLTIEVLLLAACCAIFRYLVNLEIISIYLAFWSRWHRIEHLSWLELNY